MSVTHIYTPLRWGVKWFNFCQHTLLGQQCVNLTLALVEQMDINLCPPSELLLDQMDINSCHPSQLLLDQMDINLCPSIELLVEHVDINLCPPDKLVVKQMDINLCFFLINL